MYGNPMRISILLGITLTYLNKMKVRCVGKKNTYTSSYVRTKYFYKNLRRGEGLLWRQPGQLPKTKENEKLDLCTAGPTGRHVRRSGSFVFPSRMPRNSRLPAWLNRSPCTRQPMEFLRQYDMYALTP